VAPSWLVDAAIYSEMKGGLHPWFTGLAVVGGVYVFGAVGAVYGPLALCVVYVLVNMYSTFMQEGVQLLPFHLKNFIMFTMVLSRVAYPRQFNANPDPSFSL
jgi:hypothetical protein